jgi:Cu/Ag efflux pump CusA
MKSLSEAIILVVLVSWLGFWEWRSALLMALFVPITLTMTFGAMHFLGLPRGWGRPLSVTSLSAIRHLFVAD